MMMRFKEKMKINIFFFGVDFEFASKTNGSFSIDAFLLQQNIQKTVFSYAPKINKTRSFTVRQCLFEYKCELYGMRHVNIISLPEFNDTQSVFECVCN